MTGEQPDVPVVQDLGFPNAHRHLADHEPSAPKIGGLAFADVRRLPLSNPRCVLPSSATTGSCCLWSISAGVRVGEPDVVAVGNHNGGGPCGGGDLLGEPVDDVFGIPGTQGGADLRHQRGGGNNARATQLELPVQGLAAVCVKHRPAQDDCQQQPERGQDDLGGQGPRMAGGAVPLTRSSPESAPWLGNCPVAENAQNMNFWG
jgi:hypothetical protein